MRLKSESKVMEAAQMAISSIENTKVIGLQMAAYGFNPVFHQEGKALLEKARRYQEEQLYLYDEQWSISQLLKNKLNHFQSQFKEHTDVVRIAYRKNPSLLQSLGIDQHTDHIWPLVRQASHFYALMLKDNLNVSPFGITEKELEEAHSETLQLLELKNERTRNKMLIRNCIQNRHAVYYELGKWVSEFQEMADHAYKDDPQKLEKFGIKALSEAAF